MSLLCQQRSHQLLMITFINTQLAIGGSRIYQMNRVAAAEETFYPACNWSYDGGMIWLIEFTGGLNQKVNLTFSHQWSGPLTIAEPLAQVQYL